MTIFLERRKEVDDDGKFKNPISGHSATTFFLRRSIAIIREITGMELDYPEFGISCLNCVLLQS